MGVRLLGQETEYAIRFRGPARPKHDDIYQAVVDALAQTVTTWPGHRRFLHKQVFMQNGGAFVYEATGAALEDGLIEGGTPECRTAGQILLYQRVQDSLLYEALSRAEETLALRGYPGELGLINNGRDAQDNLYGVQENYELEAASGGALWALRFLLLVLIPFSWGMGLLSLLIQLAWMPVMLGSVLMASFRSVEARDDFEQWISGDDSRCPESVSKVMRRVDDQITVFMGPSVWVFSVLYRLFMFRSARGGLTAHLASRVAFTGAGSLGDEDRFYLSERGRSNNALVRTSGQRTQRAVFDFSNLVKDWFGPGGLRGRGYFKLLRRFQRLQIGGADANRCDVAHFLRWGTTRLVINAAEAGVELPQLVDPLAASVAIDADASLQTKVDLVDGRQLTALELQLDLHQKITKHLAQSDVVSLEDREVLRLWREVLLLLESDPARLLGRVDWVSKRYLMETAADDVLSRKKIDIKYGELGDGYHEQLLQSGLSLRLVSDQDLVVAKTTAPQDTPAAARTRLLDSLSSETRTVRVGWDSVRVGGAWGQVIKLDRFRS